MNTHATISPALLEATEALGDALLRSEPIAAFRAANARLDADGQARGLLDDLAEAGAKLRREQTEGTVTREDIDRVRTAQQRAWSDKAIMAFAEAQQEASAYLPEANKIISELLGWDFAQMASAPVSC